jgi:putative transposase
MPPIRPEVLDELLKNYQKPEDLLGQDGLLQQLTKALVERALGGELTHYLGYEKNALEGRGTGNSRNGTTPKTLRGKRGQVQIDVPRDRNSEFEPQLVKKGQTRFDGLDENIISLYARGMTQREIQGHLEEIYSVEISPSLISTVTDAVMDEVRAWQARPLDTVYPILYLDALQVTELKNRGVQDIFIACVDGLKGFPEAIEAVFPQAQVQLCLVHLVRHSLSYVSHKDRKQVATDLKAIYHAATLEEGERQLAEFEEAWAGTYPVIAKSWQANWPRVVPMFGYPTEIRRVIYTTNTIESLIMTLRKVSKNRPLFPSDEAVFKLLYLALRNISNRWTMPIPNWSGALNQFAILFDGRVPMGGLNSNPLTQTA